MSFKEFSTLEIDAIGEILNISLGSSATALSTMLSTRTDITTPKVTVVAKEEFEFEDLEPAIGVEITYVEGLRGSNIMLLKRADVKMIVEMMMGMEIPENQFELNEINLSAICEAMNQMMGASATALSEFLGETVNISTPTTSEVRDVHEFKEKYFADEDRMVCVEFVLRIGDSMGSKFMNLMPIDLAKKLVSSFLPEGMLDMEEKESAPEPAPAAAPEPEEETSNRMMSQEEIEALLAGGDAGVQEAPQEEETSNRMMSQEEIEALLAGGDAGAQEEPPEEETSNRMMSQEEIEALVAGGDAGVQEAPAPQPAPQAQPAPAAAAPVESQPVQSAPQPMAQPQMAMQQPMMQPMMSNPMTDQMMAQMQQMTQMMSQMQQVMMEQMQNRNASGPKKLNVHPLPADPLAPRTSIGEEQEENMDMILGVPLEVSVEIGRTRKLVKDILEFTKGSLVVLDKVAGEQVDLFVNGQCIAKGDVVVVEDNFGIRITEILAEDIPVVE